MVVVVVPLLPVSWLLSAWLAMLFSLSSVATVMIVAVVIDGYDDGRF